MSDEIIQANIISKNLNDIYKRKRAALYALSLRYAALAIQHFRSVQGNQAFWKNQTRQALDRMFTDAFQEGNAVGWFMAHGTQYGVYLELANNRAHESIRPTVSKFLGNFMREVKALYSDN
jgi:hypothetical protein